MINLNKHKLIKDEYKFLRKSFQLLLVKLFRYSRYHLINGFLINFIALSDEYQFIFIIKHNNTDRILSLKKHISE